MTEHDDARAKQYRRRVEHALDAERAKRDALRQLAAEDRGTIVAPILETLRDRLARPRTPTRWRVQGWQPEHSRALLAAQFKSGKTTLRDNLVRSLVDGDPFLGAYPVRAVERHVVILDLEMSQTQGEDWLAAQRIVRDDRIVPVWLRGNVRAFDIFDPGCRTEWAQRLQNETSYLIVDCARPILDAFGFDENRDAGRLLVALDALLAEAGIPEGLLVHHMGHAGERSRGDSRYRDWPDSEWKLMRQTDDPASARFVSAFGRDVDVRESQLLYDAVTRRLTIAAGSRQDAKSAAVLAAIVALLKDRSEPMTGRGIKKALEDDHAKQAVDVALHLGTQNGTLTTRQGAKNARLYSVSQCPEASQECPKDTAELSVSQCPGAFIRPGHTDTHQLRAGDIEALA